MDGRSRGSPQRSEGITTFIEPGRLQAARVKIDRLDMLDAVLAFEQQLEEQRGNWQAAKRIIARRGRILRAQYKIAQRALASHPA